MCDDLDQNQIVSTRGEFQFTRKELSKALDRVKDRDNWKNPINRVLTIRTAREKAAIEEAVIFFCGCAAEFVCLQTRPLKRGGTSAKYSVQAVGYYVAVGA